MGLLAFIAINAVLVAAVYAALRRPTSIHDLLREFAQKPLSFFVPLTFIGSCLIAGWGILSGGRLSWPVNTPWGTLQSWQLAGLVAIGFVFGFFAYSIYENDFKRKD